MYTKVELEQRIKLGISVDQKLWCLVFCLKCVYIYLNAFSVCSVNIVLKLEELVFSEFMKVN